MEMTVYNPQKGRLETIDTVFTDENTTWFNCKHDHDVYLISDFEGGLLIKEYGYSCPTYNDVSRADIGFNQKRAKRKDKEIRELCR